MQGATSRMGHALQALLGVGNLARTLMGRAMSPANLPANSWRHVLFWRRYRVGLDEEDMAEEVLHEFEENQEESWTAVNFAGAAVHYTLVWYFF